MNSTTAPSPSIVVALSTPVLADDSAVRAAKWAIESAGRAVTVLPSGRPFSVGWVDATAGDLADMQATVRAADWVIADFSPGSELADAVGVAALARFTARSTDSTGLILLAPADAPLPGVWRDWPLVVRYAPEWPDELAVALGSMLASPPPAVPRIVPPVHIERAKAPEVAVLMPLDDTAAEIADWAVQAAKVVGFPNPEGAVRVLDAHAPLDENLEIMARATMVIADVSPTADGSPDADVVSLAVAARFAVGHGRSLVLCSSAARLPDTWAAEPAECFDRTTPRRANAANIALRDCIADRLRAELDLEPVPLTSASRRLAVVVPPEELTSDARVLDFPAPLEKFRTGPGSLMITGAITVPEGESWVIPAGAVIQLMSGANWRVDGELRIVGEAAAPVTISGSAWGHFLFSGPKSRGHMEWAIIAGGASEDGGGVLVRKGAAFHGRHLIFRQCRATRQGGGVCVVGTADAPCRDISFTACRFERNNARSGGGANINAFAKAEFVDCTFAGNRASALGGGLTVRGDARTPTDVAAIRCRFEANVSENGGGANINFYSTAHFVDGAFARNQAGDNGGGLIALGTADRPTRITADRVHFVGNFAQSGAGLNANVHSMATLTDCVLALNEAKSWGGGVSSFGHGQRPTEVAVRHCRIAQNRSGHGDQPDIGQGPNSTIAVSNPAQTVAPRATLDGESIANRGA